MIEIIISTPKAIRFVLIVHHGTTPSRNVGSNNIRILVVSQLGNEIWREKYTVILKESTR